MRVHKNIKVKFVDQGHRVKVNSLFSNYASRHDYTIGTLDVLQACDACADMGMTYSVIVQCADCVVFPRYMPFLCPKSSGCAEGFTHISLDQK